MRALGPSLNDQLSPEDRQRFEAIRATVDPAPPVSEDRPMPRQRSRLRAAVNLLLITLALPALAAAALWLLGCSNGDLSLVRFGPRGAARVAALQASDPDEVHTQSQAITPITSLSASRPTELGGSTSGSLYASADFIDLVVWSGTTATVNLVYYDTSASGWVKYGADCAVDTNKNACRYNGKRGQFYWHVFKSAGTVTGCYIEQVYRGSLALGSIEPAQASGLASVSVTAPIGGDGTSGSPLNMAAASDSVPGYMAAADHALLPSSGQKLALAGSSGTPGAGNVYVTDADSRMTNSRTPSAHAASHKAGGSDPLLAAPGAIGGGTPAAGTFDVLAATTRTETPSIGTSSSTQHALPSGTADLVAADSAKLLPAPSSAGRLPYDSGSAWTALAAGTSGQYLKSGGAGAPSWAWPLSVCSMGSSTVLANLYFGPRGNAGSTTLLNNVAARVVGSGTINFKSLTALSNTGTGSLTVQVYKSTDGFTFSAQSGQTRTITVAVGNAQTDSGALADLAVSDGDWILLRVTGYTATVASVAAVVTASGGAVLG